MNRVTRTHPTTSRAGPAACGTPPAVLMTHGLGAAVGHEASSNDVERPAGRGLPSGVTRHRVLGWTLTVCAWSLLFVADHGDAIVHAAGKHVQQALQLKNIEFSDPVADMKAAVKKGDYRFIGLMGYALIVPGVENYHEKYKAKYGVNIIEGTSDVIESDEQKRLQGIAYDYATKYNQLLLKEIERKRR